MFKFLLELYGINNNNNDNNINIWNYICSLFYSKKINSKIINKLLSNKIECIITFNIIEHNMLYYECLVCKYVFICDALNKWFEIKKTNICPHCNQLWTNNCIYRNL